MSVRSGSPIVSHRRVKAPPMWIVALAGEHDVSTTPDIGVTLTRAIASGDPVVIDLQPATFADSSILGAILNAAYQAGRSRFAVVLPTKGEVRRVFDLIGGPTVVTTCLTLRDAVDWFYPVDRDVSEQSE